MKPAITRVIARDVAIGISLEDIASLRNLPLAEVKRIASGKVFSNAVMELQAKLDEELVSAEAEDPIRLLLRSKAKDAASRLGDEVNNFDSDDGATASTRIKAADSILDKLGYGRQEASQQNLAVIMLSTEKLKAVRSVDMSILESVPDMVDGFVAS